jgi:hypothetical protein
MYVSTYLGEGKPVKLERNTLTVAFPKNFSLHKESLERKENKALVEKVISEALNGNPRVNFILTQDELHRNNNHDDPALKSALDAFGARVIRED